MLKKIHAIEIRRTKVFEYDINLIILKEAKNFIRKKNEHDQLFRQQKKKTFEGFEMMLTTTEYIQLLACGYLSHIDEVANWNSH